METLVIKFEPELKPILIHYDFSTIKEQIIEIMEKRYEVERLYNEGKKELINKAMYVLIWKADITKNAPLLNIPENILQQTVQLLEKSNINELHFTIQYPFVIKEESYLLWEITPDYQLIAQQETTKLLDNLQNKLSGQRPD